MNASLREEPGRSPHETPRGRNGRGSGCSGPEADRQAEPASPVTAALDRLRRVAAAHDDDKPALPPSPR